LQQLKATLTPGQVSEILEGVADSMAERVTIPDAPLDVRLEHVVAFLNTAVTPLQPSQQRRACAVDHELPLRAGDML